MTSRSGKACNSPGINSSGCNGTLAEVPRKEKKAASETTLGRTYVRLIWHCTALYVYRLVLNCRVEETKTEKGEKVPAKVELEREEREREGVSR